VIVKYRVPIELPAGEKNIHPISISVRIRYGCHPWIKNHLRTHTRRVGYSTGIRYPYPNCYPYCRPSSDTHHAKGQRTPIKVSLARFICLILVLQRAPPRARNIFSPIICIIVLICMVLPLHFVCVWIEFFLCVWIEIYIFFLLVLETLCRVTLL
jgi:hypothetical protein